MVADIRQALDAYPREQLQEILSYVFKEYVVEGNAATTGALGMLDARTELEGLSFAELMTWLQLHVDVPELAQFEVAGNRVSVRAGGRAIAIEAPSTPATAPPPVTTAAATQVAPPPPQPMPPAPATSSQSAAPAAAGRPNAPAQPMPPPVAGPTSAPSTTVPASSQPQTQTPASADKDKKDEGGPASRFSWLEVD
jgi:hypothetical protein